MATAQFSTLAQITSDAEFRTFGSGLSTALAAVGMVKTSDTGQVNWVTVTKPAGATTSAGYEIWRFADAAQATQPLFIKLEYGTSGTATRLALWVTVGTGSDGAGAITGIRQARQQIDRSNSTATVDTFVSAGDGYLTIAAFVATGASAVTFFIALERLREADGDVDTATGTAGFFVAGQGGISSPFFNSYLYDGSASEVPGPSSSIMFPILAQGVVSGSSGVFKGTTYAFPYYPFLGAPRAPSRAIAMHQSSDAAAAQTFSCSLYGVTHIFRSSGYSMSVFGRAGTPTLAVRAE